MKTLRALLALATLTVAATLHAQGTGTINGRVVDLATGLTLAGVRVSVEPGALETYSADGGRFSLGAVPAGTVTVRASYLGYDDLAREVAVTAGATATVELAFNDDTIRLPEFVIEGTLVGTARALNQQRAAATLTNIVASDEIGRFPDQNAAESLQRLPGVALYRDQGEGRFIVLRGLNYTFNNVTVNGAQLASPELGDRAVALDVLPADSLAALRVSKVLTPDMDGEGLGGSVDIQTKSPFENTGRSLNVTAGSIYSRLTEEFTPKFNATYSDIFSEGRLGLLVGVTYQERDFGSHNFEEDGWEERDSPGGDTFFAPANLGFRDYEIVRTRYGANASLEFKPAATALYFIRASYTRFTDEEYRHQTYIPFERGSVAALTATSGTITGISRVRRDIRIREKDQDVFAVTAGGEVDLGPWSLDGQVEFSQGNEERPDELTVRFRRNSGDVGLSYAFDGPYSLAITQTAGASLSGTGFFTNLDRFELANATGEETNLGARVNARHDFAGATPWYIQFGAAARTKEKTSEEDVSRFSVPSSFTFANLSQDAGDYPFLSVPRLNPDAITAAFHGNRSAFGESVQVLDSAIADWTSNEDVLAAYAMGGATFGSFELLAGLRAEHTAFDTAGFEIEDESTVRPTSSDRSYTNWLPGVHGRYNLGENTVVRASYSRSILRPAFGETALFREIINDDEEIVQGNPDLKELESDNLDVSVEHYLPDLGVFSVAAFHKDVSNFSYEFETGSTDPRFPTYTTITFANGSEGTITGLELAYQQQFRSLPAPFDGLGFLANYTFLDAEAKYPTRPGEVLPFIGQSEYVGNVALTYEKHGLFVRLALNFRGERLREDEPIGGDVTEDRYVDDFAQLDLSTSYRFDDNWEIFAEVTNLTNEPFRVFFKTPGGPERLAQFEEYDWSANFGVRWKL